MTLILFWIEKDGVVQDPTVIAPIATAEVITAVNADLSVAMNTEMTLIEVEASVEVFNFQQSHSIFVEGQVFKEDLVNFESTLTEYFASGRSQVFFNGNTKS